MPEDTSGPSGFKIVDKRSFAADGTPRENVQQEKRESDEQPLRREPGAVAAGSEPGASREEFGELEDQEMTGFETLVSYLSTTAMFQLGLLAGPGGERIPADLVSARRTIDLLEVLEEKTRGNLTSSEAQLLETVLYELRLSYVEAQKRGARKSK